MSYYTEDDEESKQLIQSKSNIFAYNENKPGYNSVGNDGQLEISDLEAGGNKNNRMSSHNVN